MHGYHVFDEHAEQGALNIVAGDGAYIYDTAGNRYLDAVGGIAGDMFAAAMVDALPDLRARVLADAAAVLPPGTGTPAARIRSLQVRKPRYG